MQRMNIQWSAKTLCRQMDAGKVNFDNAVQRSLVWDIGKKSLLIHSMVYGYAIPAMYFTRDENGVYDSLDGKQRSNAISEYLHDEFSLTVDTPPVYDDEGKEENISGLTFSQLPEWAQDRIKDYSLTIYYYEGMTEHEVREFFRRLNNGKPLSAVELTRVNTPCLDAFQSLAEHPTIRCVTTEAAKKRFTDENIAMQVYHIVTVADPDFSTKAFRQWATSVSVDDAVMERIRDGLDAYMSFISLLSDTDDGKLDDETIKANKKVLKAVKTRTNFVSCALFCTLAVENGVDQEQINYVLRSFFSGKPSTSEEYNKTVGSGSAKPTAVKTRKEIITKLADSQQVDIPF